MSIGTRSNMTNDWKRVVIAFTGCSCNSLNQKLQEWKSDVYNKPIFIRRHRPVFCKGYWFENFQKTSNIWTEATANLMIDPIFLSNSKNLSLKNIQFSIWGKGKGTLKNADFFFAGTQFQTCMALYSVIIMQFMTQ